LVIPRFCHRRFKAILNGPFERFIFIAEISIPDKQVQQLQGTAYAQQLLSQGSATGVYATISLNERGHISFSAFAKTTQGLGSDHSVFDQRESKAAFSSFMCYDYTLLESETIDRKEINLETPFLFECCDRC